MLISSSFFSYSYISVAISSVGGFPQCLLILVCPSILSKDWKGLVRGMVPRCCAWGGSRGKLILSEGTQDIGGWASFLLTASRGEPSCLLPGCAHFQGLQREWPPLGGKAAFKPLHFQPLIPASYSSSPENKPLFSSTAGKWGKVFCFVLFFPKLQMPPSYYPLFLHQEMESQAILDFSLISPCFTGPLFLQKSRRMSHNLPNFRKLGNGHESGALIVYFTRSRKYGGGGGH